MKILTYNILTAERGLFPFQRNWWFKRMLGTINMIKKENPDIFVLNEVTLLQMFVLLFLKGYNHRGGFSRNPVFFKKDFEVTYSKCKKYDARSRYSRSYTDVWLKDSKFDIYHVIGTHIDWDLNTRERQKRELMDEIGMNLENTFICGDFNVENDTIPGMTATKPDVGTYHDETGKRTAKLDYIFNKRGIEKCTVLTKYTKESDHYPVVIEW